MIHAIFLAAFLIGQIEFLYFSSEHQCSFVFEVLSKSLSHRLKVQRAEISNKAILFPFVQFAVFYNGIDLSLGWEFGTKFDFKVEQNSFQLLPKSFCICFLPPRIGVTLSHPNLYCWLPWYQMIYPPPSILGSKDDLSRTLPTHFLQSQHRLKFPLFFYQFWMTAPKYEIFPCDAFWAECGSIIWRFLHRTGNYIPHRTEIEINQMNTNMNYRQIDYIMTSTHCQIRMFENLMSLKDKELQLLLLGIWLRPTYPLFKTRDIVIYKP